MTSNELKTRMFVDEGERRRRIFSELGNLTILDVTLCAISK